MDEYDCRCLVAGFVKGRQYDKAIEFCSTYPYSNIRYCQNYLGWNFYREEDFVKSESWFREAAEQGDAEALFGLASISMKMGDYVSAISFFERSAELGFFRAHLWIALIYYHGSSDVPRDLSRAVHFFEIAANHDFFLAKRFILFLKSRKNILSRFSAWAMMVPLVVRALVISCRDPHDCRIVDVGYLGKEKISSPNCKIF